MSSNACDESHGRYESVFCIFMAAVAFLWRGLGGETDPALLALFGLLLGSNLAAARALRRWAGKPAVAASIALANCALVAAIVARLGGADTEFWVLYLLPIYSSCMLLGPRETTLITAGAVGLTLAGSVPDSGVWGAHDVVAAAVKVAVLMLASALTLGLAQRERQAKGRLEEGRARTRELELHARIQREHAENASGLADAGMLSAAAAHDLNNTLSVVLGYADIALANPETPSAIRRDIEGIRRSAAIAQRTASTLLGISRKTSVAPQPVDLNETIEDIVGLLRLTLQTARVSALLRLDPAVPRVMARPTQIQRLLLNLCSNASRAMKENGGGALLVTTRMERGAVVVTVEDTGPGLTDAVLTRLFQPFVESGAADGHGLGLYICWEIARDNGGRLHGENRPGGGARFSLFLPAAGPAECPSQEAPEPTRLLQPAIAAADAAAVTDVPLPFQRVF